MYRPEFVYPEASPNTLDQSCLYSWDGTNTPAFVSPIPAGALIQKIPLRFDQDSTFFIRGIEIVGNGLLVGLGDINDAPLVQPLAPGLDPTMLAPLWAETDGQGETAAESDNWGIECPPGSALYAYVQNPAGNPVNGPVITVFGIKRYTGEQCR
jgi:hypothetical protein